MKNWAKLTAFNIIVVTVIMGIYRQCFSEVFVDESYKILDD